MLLLLVTMSKCVGNSINIMIVHLLERFPKRLSIKGVTRRPVESYLSSIQLARPSATDNLLRVHDQSMSGGELRGKECSVGTLVTNRSRADDPSNSAPNLTKVRGHPVRAPPEAADPDGSG
jgi:hypothetical protein